MTETAEDYELFHYGVKGMKWGVRRNPRPTLDFSKTRKVRKDLGELDRKNAKELAREEADGLRRNNAARLKGGEKAYSNSLARESARISKLELDQVDKEDRMQQRYAKTRDKEVSKNRQVMDESAKQYGGNQKTAGKLFVESLKINGYSVGMREARAYGATNGQAVATMLIAGPMAGKLYREVVLQKELLK